MDRVKMIYPYTLITFLACMSVTAAAPRWRNHHWNQEANTPQPVNDQAGEGAEAAAASGSYGDTVQPASAPAPVPASASSGESHKVTVCHFPSTHSVSPDGPLVSLPSRRLIFSATHDIMLINLSSPHPMNKYPPTTSSLSKLIK